MSPGGRYKIDAFPVDLQVAMQAFDMDKNGTVSAVEVAAGAKMYAESQRSRQRLMILGVIQGVALILLSLVIFGLTFAAVEVAKETKTSGGALTDAGTGQLVAVGEQAVDVPLGALPVIGASVLAQVRSLTVKYPEGGWVSVTVTRRELLAAAVTGGTGELSLWAEGGHRVRIAADPGGAPTEAAVELATGRGFPVCAPCAKCGALSVMLNGAERARVDAYLAKAAAAVRSGASAACPAGAAAPARRAAAALQAAAYDPISDADFNADICNGMVGQPQGTDFFGFGEQMAADVLSDPIRIKFEARGGASRMLAEVFENGNLVKYVIFDAGASYTYDAGVLVSCSSLAPWSFTLSNLRNGDTGMFDFLILNLTEGMQQGHIPASPTVEQCRAVGPRGPSGGSANAAAGRRGRALAVGEGEDLRNAKDRAALKVLQDQMRAIDTKSRRATPLSTQQSKWAMDAYYCSGTNHSMLSGTCQCVDNACMYLPPAAEHPCAFVFVGSDDIWDFLSGGAGAWDAKCVGNKEVTEADRPGKCRWMHGGFVSEFLRLQPAVEARMANMTTCTSYSQVAWVGHSLGGAMSTAARQYFNEQGDVTTYGCPQTFDLEKDARACVNSGRRLYHESDPVAGSLFGINAAYWHAGGATQEIYCKAWYWSWWYMSYYCTNDEYDVRDKADCTSYTGTFGISFKHHATTVYDQYDKTS